MSFSVSQPESGSQVESDSQFESSSQVDSICVAEWSSPVESIGDSGVGGVSLRLIRVDSGMISSFLMGSKSSRMVWSWCVRSIEFRS